MKWNRNFFTLITGIISASFFEIDAKADLAPKLAAVMV
ncbi:MAG: hypothetical protein JWM99_2735, partial [Verrucomicrobiales bacterium]|nr:hypothetical protein [Verrucomicrobiales bacterium]